MIQQKEKIWVVFNPEGRAPYFIHHTEESAKTEARRLAARNPEHVFHVMESIGFAIKQEVAFYAKPIHPDNRWPDRGFIDDIPF